MAGQKEWWVWAIWMSLAAFTANVVGGAITGFPWPFVAGIVVTGLLSFAAVVRYTAIKEEEPEGSDFGAGVVVCLAKFSEHLSGASSPYDERMIYLYNRWINELTPEQRVKMQEQAKLYPTGDAARDLQVIASAARSAEIRGSAEAALSNLVEMWMNAASDHFYDLDRRRAPDVLIELADLCLLIGHGFTGKTWTMEHVDRIRELWRASCIAVDKQLGVKPDWGSY